jgi:hypothetical protein
MSAREQIISALATVDGLVPSDASPNSPVAGAAWPRWVQSTYSGKLHYLTVSTYDVCVVLPAGQAETTVESADGFVDTVADALLKVGTIEYVAPVAFQFDSGTTMPGIQFRFTPLTCD